MTPRSGRRAAVAEEQVKVEANATAYVAANHTKWFGYLAPKRRDIPANERSPLRTCAPSSRHCLVAPAEGVALLR
jgi:hypothetical protein